LDKTCHNCNKKGHIAADCYSKGGGNKGNHRAKEEKDSHATSNTSGMFVGACFECNKIGNDNWGSMILENDERSFEMIG
jgi:hypothetical protein